MTDEGVFGAGLNIDFVAIKRYALTARKATTELVRVPYPKVLTGLFGGLGSDTFSIAGDTPAVSSNDLKGHSGLIVHSIENTANTNLAYADLGIKGISANIGDNEESSIVVTPATSEITLSKDGGTASYAVVLTRRPTSSVIVQALAPNLPPEDKARNYETIEFTGPHAVADADGKSPPPP